MRTIFFFFLSAIFSTAFTSCDDSEEIDLKAEYYRLLKLTINSEYDSLPSLERIEWNQVDDFTNFHFDEKKNEVLYKNEFAYDTEGATLLFGKNDGLIIMNMGKIEVLYKTELTYDPMKYTTPEILGGRVNDNLAYLRLKDARDSVITVKYITTPGEMSHVYVCGY